jgi:hypothetical protein
MVQSFDDELKKEIKQSVEEEIKRQRDAIDDNLSSVKKESWFDCDYEFDTYLEDGEESSDGKKISSKLISKCLAIKSVYKLVYWKIRAAIKKLQYKVNSISKKLENLKNKETKADLNMSESAFNMLDDDEDDDDFENACSMFEATVLDEYLNS